MILTLETVESLSEELVGRNNLSLNIAILYAVNQHSLLLSGREVQTGRGFYTSFFSQKI